MNLNNALEEIGLRFGADGELEYANKHEDDAVQQAAYPIMRVHVTPAKFSKLLDQAMVRLAAQILVASQKKFPEMTEEMVSRGLTRIGREVEDAIRREMTRQITSLIKERLANMPISLSVKGEVGA